MRTQLLLERLDRMGDVLAKRGDVLMLLGLGSVGIELARLDEYSDLDFFVIVQPGCKQKYIDQLDWLEETYPLAYAFKNSDAGHKFLFEDGIYGEFAVFEEEDLKHAAYPEGRIVWKDPSFHNESLAQARGSFPRTKSDDLHYPLNEALTNLYVGLGRFARGEKLSAARFVYNYALDNVIRVLHLLEEEIHYFPDPFGNDRRIEKRFPKFAERLPLMLQGYNDLPDAALHILNYVEEKYALDSRMCEEIRQLARKCKTL